MRGREDEDDGGIHILNHAGAFHAGFAGHFHIQKHHLRAMLLHQLEQLVPVRRLADQREALHALDHFALNGAHAHVIVGDDDAYLVHTASSANPECIQSISTRACAIPLAREKKPRQTL